MLRQTLNGVRVNVKCDGAETTLAPLLAGLVEQFDLKTSGGSPAPMPAVLNRKRIAVGDSTQKISCSFTVPHIKETAKYTDIELAVKGKFDAHYDQTVKCDYVSIVYDK